MVDILVEDDGPGIPEEKRGELFTRGARLDTTGKPGTGLGLAIVRDVAEIYGGCDPPRGKRRPWRPARAPEPARGLSPAAFSSKSPLRRGAPSLGSAKSNSGWRVFLCVSVTCCLPAASPLSPAPGLRAALRAMAPGALRRRTWTPRSSPATACSSIAEGTWLRNHPIPADKSGAGYNYELPDEIEQQVRKMVEDVTARPTSPIARKIGDAYAAWMDEAGIEARGLAPLKPYLARIDAVSNRGDLVRLMMEPGYASPVNVGISADQDNPARYTAVAGQARLGLPTRDYYLLKGEKYDTIRSAYRAYIVKLGQLAGLSDPEGRADRIIALETRLSQDQWTPERRRDPVATHNPMTRAQLRSWRRSSTGRPRCARWASPRRPRSISRSRAL